MIRKFFALNLNQVTCSVQIWCGKWAHCLQLQHALPCLGNWMYLVKAWIWTLTLSLTPVVVCMSGVIAKWWMNLGQKNNYNTKHRCATKKVNTGESSWKIGRWKSWLASVSSFLFKIIIRCQNYGSPQGGMSQFWGTMCQRRAYRIICMSHSRDTEYKCHPPPFLESLSKGTASVTSRNLASCNSH